MITANLTGNLGNHMWNYVICRIVADSRNFEWGINPQPTHDYFGGQSQMYFMDIDYGNEVKLIGKNSRGLNMYENIPNEYYDMAKEHIFQGDGCLINMYDPEVFNIQDNTMIHLISQSEKYLIEKKNQIQNWFRIKPEYFDSYSNKLESFNINLDDNTCVINFRGGEYMSVRNLIPSFNYWKNCINYMTKINPKMKFVIITDDVYNAKIFIGDYPCFHFDVGTDFFIVNQSKYSILSASSFSWWASWLNQSAKLIIGPKYWSRHNISNGYWSQGDSWTKGWFYMNRDGILEDHESCEKEALEFYKKNNLI
jgi:hypothetical protein